LYVERDGAFVLDVEGAVDKARVDEFRANNIALTNQLAEQRKRFEAIESEQVKSIAAQRDSLNAKLTAIQVDQGCSRLRRRRVCDQLRLRLMTLTGRCGMLQSSTAMRARGLEPISSLRDYSCHRISFENTERFLFRENSHLQTLAPTFKQKRELTLAMLSVAVGS
jgi:hypothetical protein